MTQQIYTVDWAEKDITINGKLRGYIIYLNGKPFEITESFGKNINNANMGSYITGYNRGKSQKITVKIGKRFY